MNEFLVSGLRKLVEKTADDFDPALLSPLTTARAIEEWALIEKIACAQKLRAATRGEDVGLDASGIVAESSGVSAGTARRQTKGARKAKGKTKQKFERGELSSTQTNAIADAVEANPDEEDRLLDLARTASTNDLVRECERVKRAAMDEAELARRQRQARHFRSWTDELGMTRISGAFEPLPGARLIAELERRSDRFFRAQSRAKGPIDEVQQRMADALISLLDDLGGSAAGKRRGPRTVVRLIVHKSAAERGWTERGEKCETADGTQVPMSAVDDAFLDSDTLVQEVTVDEVDVRSIKTMKKYIPKRIRDALEARGMFCVCCGSTKGLQIDHTIERRDGGPTTLFNVGWLCWVCHPLKTRGLLRVWRDEQGNYHHEHVRARAPAGQP